MYPETTFYIRWVPGRCSASCCTRRCQKLSAFVSAILPVNIIVLAFAHEYQPPDISQVDLALLQVYKLGGELSVFRRRVNVDDLGLDAVLLAEALEVMLDSLLVA